MADAKPQLSVALATPLDVGPAGLAVQVKLPAARKLQLAALQLTADSVAESAATLTLDSDAGIVQSGVDSSKDARWLSIDLGAEKSLVGLAITTPTADGVPGTSAQTGIRVRMQSAGNWLPLPPRDTFPFSSKTAQGRFPAVAASRLMVETLSENKVGGNFTGVLVPGPAKLAAVAVTVTPQPCHVSIAVADEAPFFTRIGPLPGPNFPVAVDGLTRALNRYLTDHPGALSIPLVIRAAANARLKFTAFDASLEPDPASPSGSGGAGGSGGSGGTGGSGSSGGSGGSVQAPPRKESPAVQPVAPLSSDRGRWCDARHAVAQGFAALPLGQSLSAVALYGRILGDAALTASLTLYADDHGRPGGTALADAIPLTPAATQANADWLRFELPQPQTLNAPWWAVLQVTVGEMLWYVADQAPAGVQPANAAALYRVGSGAWLPADTLASAWLQSKVLLLSST